MVSGDEFEIVTDQPAPAKGRPTRRPQRWTRRAAPWVAAAVTLVVVGAAIATPTRLPQHGDGPTIGLVDLDLSQPPTVTWETVLADPHVIEDVIGDHAVLRPQLAGASGSVLGLDLATGSATWTYDIDAHTCQWGSPMVCVQDPGGPEATIVSVDLETGHQAARAYPEAVAAIAVDDGVAVILQTNSTDEDVVLLGGDGRERWRVTVDAANLENVPWWAYAHRVGDELWFETMTTARIHIPTGQVRTDPVTSFVRDDGTSVSISGDVGTIRTADGEAQVELDEAVMWVDDDLGGTVQLTRSHDGLFAAQQRESKTELWRFPEQGCNPEARLSGVVVISCWEGSEEHLYGVDELTGDVIWDRGNTDWIAAASRDTLVFVSSADAVLRALDPVTGEMLWEFPMPAVAAPGEPFTTPTPDGLLISSAETILRLAWP